MRIKVSLWHGSKAHVATWLYSEIMDHDEFGIESLMLVSTLCSLYYQTLWLIFNWCGWKWPCNSLCCLKI